MRNFLGIFLLAIILMATQSYAKASTFTPENFKISVKQYEKWMHNSKLRPYMTLYLLGVQNGLIFANSENLLLHQKLLFCTPKNYTITHAQLMQILNSYIRSENIVEKYPNIPIGALMLKSLGDVFPCR